MDWITHAHASTKAASEGNTTAAEHHRQRARKVQGAGRYTRHVIGSNDVTAQYMTDLFVKLNRSET